MTSVPVYMSCTATYEPILARALASWRRLPDITAEFHIDKFVMEAPDADKLFKTTVWYACLLHKCEFFLSALESIADSSVVSVFSDADIAVFPALAAHWATLTDDMHARDLDCLFMREGAGTQVNGGLLVARSTPRMRAFWGQVVDLFRADRTVEMGEQTLINRLLPGGGLRWDYLDADKVVWAGVIPDKREDLCFHHAVCADGITAKGEQMDWVSQCVLGVQPSAPPTGFGGEPRPRPHRAVQVQGGHLLPRSLVGSGRLPCVRVRSGTYPVARGASRGHPHHMQQHRQGGVRVHAAHPRLLRCAARGGRLLSVRCAGRGAPRLTGPTSRRPSLLCGMLQRGSGLLAGHALV